MDTKLILGALKEHKDHTNRRLDRIETKIDHLFAFKWKILGGAAVVSVVITYVLELGILKR